MKRFKLLLKYSPDLMRYYDIVQQHLQQPSCVITLGGIRSSSSSSDISSNRKPSFNNCCLISNVYKCHLAIFDTQYHDRKFD